MRTLQSLVVLFCTIGIVQAQLPEINWEEITIKDPQMSPGFVDIHDLDGDGFKELIVSTLMEEGSAQDQASTRGAIRSFSSNAANGLDATWSESVLLPTSEGLPFLNEPQIMDVDEDGHEDILVQQGFLQTNGGSHQWLKGPSFSQRFNFTSETTHGNTMYFWHQSRQYDLDGDGKKDIITTSAQTQEPGIFGPTSLSSPNVRIEWYRHLGNGQFDYYLIDNNSGGSFIDLYDIDADGDQDIVVSQFWHGTSEPALIWLELQTRPTVANNFTGSWVKHTIDHTTGLGYHFEFTDIDNDGTDELVYDNHNNEDNGNITDQNGNVINPGLYWFEFPADPRTSTQWQKHTIYEGFRTNLFDFSNPASQGCPGIFSIGDIDGNGLKDIVVPGDGNDTLYLFRQRADHTFKKEILDDNGKMYGMCKIDDIDGDGRSEILVTKHNFPNDFFDALFNGNPPGFIKILKPVHSCEVPHPIQTTQIGTNTVTLNWQPNSSALAYTIRGNVQGAPPTVTVDINDPNQDRFYVRNLQPDQTYYWQIQSVCDASGTERSIWTTENQFTTLAECAAPANTHTSAITTTSAVLNWIAQANAASYVIRGGEVNGGLISIDVLDGTRSSFSTRNALRTGKNYKWQIAARCSDGSLSDWSDFAFFSTPNAKYAAHESEWNSFAIYPNPAKDFALVQLPYSSNWTIDLINENGQIIQSTRSGKALDTIKLELGQLTPGLLIIRLSDSERVITNRIVLQ